MNNCTCHKLNCNDSCLCACHREEDLAKIDKGLSKLKDEIFPELREINYRLYNIDKEMDLAIERMQQYDLKK